MKNILKAEFKKAFSAKFIYVLIAIAIFVPLVTSGFLELIERLLSGGAGAEEVLSIFPTTFLYANSFNPLSNLGMVVLITIVVFAANEFTHNTIRNKIIAGYNKATIFLSTLIYNLVIMSVIMLVHTSATYVINGLFSGFVASEFLDVFKYGIIGFSSLFVLYGLVTVLMFKYKTIVGPLLISLGGLFFLNALYTTIKGIAVQDVDLTFIQHVLPILRVVSPTMLVNMTTIKLEIEVNLWWVDLLVNIAHMTWITFLGIYIAKKTDYK